MFIIDTHAHYDDERFDEDRDELLQSMEKNGVGIIVNSGASMRGVRDTILLMEKYDFVYGTAGIHPTETDILDDEKYYEELLQAARLEKILAVGEIGLDYYWDEADVNKQKEHFVRQIDIARQVKKPILIHSRDAAADTMSIMKAENCQDIGGIIHCYSYSKELAKEFLNMNFYLGIGGVVTFKNSKKLVEVVEYMPLDRIVLETDSPYLSPEPNRGQRNSSLNLPYVVEKIAQIKGISTEEVIKATYDNACRVFGLNL